MRALVKALTVAIGLFGLHTVTAPPAAAALSCLGINGSGTDFAITSAAPVNSPIEVNLGKGHVLTDLDVVVNLTYNWSADLIISVSDGTNSVILSNQRGGSTSNFSGTIFDDEATTTIADAPGPRTGSFIPDAPLSTFDGDALNGTTFTLNIVDLIQADDGTLNSWSVQWTAECDPDGDAVESSMDNCPSHANSDQLDTDADGEGDACDVNDDNDPLLDAVDVCPAVASANADGCPAFARSITLSYSKGAFRGTLAAPGAAPCAAAAKVQIFKSRTGPDLKLATVTTGAAGKFKLTKARKPGKFYAKSARRVLTSTGVCSATRSPTLTLK